MREYIVPQDTKELKNLIILMKAQTHRKWQNNKKNFKNNKELYFKNDEEIMELEAYVRDLNDELAAREDK